MPGLVNQSNRFRADRLARNACGLTKSRARKSHFYQPIQSDLGCPVLSRKKFRYACRANHLYKLAPSRLDKRGVRVVTNVSAGCGGRENVARRVTSKRTAKSCGPGAPWLVPSLLMRDVGPGGPDTPHSQTTVTQTSRTPGRARRKPLKPLRGESRALPGRTCGDYARMLFYSACEAAGAAGARLSMRPLSFEGQF